MPVHKFKIGSLECMVLQEGEREPDPALFVGNFKTLPESDVLEAYHAMPAAYRGWSYNPLYIDTGSQKVLVDVGFGAAAPSPAFGQALQSLQAEGIALSEIDSVVITHAHGDHLNGLMDQAGGLAFPEAQIFVWKGEWDYWMSPESQARFQGDTLAQVQRLAELMQPRLMLIEAEQTFLPDITAVSLPGHTPGHMGILVESGGEGLLAIVDAAHALFQMQHPDWSPHFDAQPEVSPVTRRAVFERAANENLLVLGYHFPFPGLGHIRRDGEAFAWQPI